MKTVLFTLVLVANCTIAFCQEDEKTWFDFWVGNWNATWTDADGKMAKGTNHVIKTLDSTVIQENFSISEGVSKGYLGTSLSVYNPKQKMWHQGYADNQGAYFNFVGEKDGDKKIFRTEVVARGEKQLIQRMVFYDIKAESFTWDWESSEDGGKIWKLNWRINYTRAR
jgi:hypothetical protein